MQKRLLSLSLLGALTAGAAVAADTPAVSGATPADAAHYRHEAFEGLGKHMKAVSMMAKGKVTLPQADMVLHAAAMNNAAKAMAGWFPAGSGPDAVETEALAAIWTDAAGFEQKRADFEAATATLLQKASANDAAGFKDALKAVGPTCGGCHDSFREDD